MKIAINRQQSERQMFCPKCKAEYREGFKECSDCGVPLVRNLSDASASSDESVRPGAAELLWTGADSSESSAIAKALDIAKIRYHKTLHEVGALPGLEKPVYAILVHARDLAAARSALDDVEHKSELPEQDAADAAESASFALAQQEGSDDSSPIEAPDYVPEDFDPKDATAEVWSGTDPAMAQGLKDSLRENGIGCKITKGEAGRRLSVLPSEESRAREIIREVVDASPPK
jgi:hypothetical protein